tara:strand:- start:2211 stop:2369 length:159 start_codon:yes stop_codon:yes gene_type:complete
MMLYESEIKRLIKKYEENKLFKNEEVHIDVRNLAETIRFWKKQSGLLKKPLN